MLATTTSPLYWDRVFKSVSEIPRNEAAAEKSLRGAADCHFNSLTA